MTKEFEENLQTLMMIKGINRDDALTELLQLVSTSSAKQIID